MLKINSENKFEKGNTAYRKERILKTHMKTGSNAFKHQIRDSQKEEDQTKSITFRIF